MTDLHPQDATPRALHVLSLGAGVQSSTMALMAAHGELSPMPDAAIFADTQAEPRAVYDHLEWLCSPNVLPFPVYRVTAGNLTEDLRAAIAGKRFASVPFYTESARKGGGRLRRQCTKEYKLYPLRRKARELLKLEAGRRPRPGSCKMWVGISTDEAARMKPSTVKWVENVYPLINKRMNRWDCLQWLRRHDYAEPPKSACTYCPFHNDALWRRMKLSDPEAWGEALEVDEMIRIGINNTKERLYLHRSLKPLAEVDLSTLEDHGQADLFNNECEGLCGV